MNTEKKKCCNGCRNGAEGQNPSCKAKLNVQNSTHKESTPFTKNEVQLVDNQ